MDSGWPLLTWKLFCVALQEVFLLFTAQSCLLCLLLFLPPHWCIFFFSAGARLQSATVATAWRFWGLCLLQPTLCWWLFCATISSYGASFRPNYCTSPCTCCWPQGSVSSSTRWSRATAPVRHRQKGWSSIKGISGVEGSDAFSWLSV